MADRSVVYRLRADIGQFRAQMAAAGASVKGAADDMTAATKEGEQFRRGLTTLGDTAGKVALATAAGLGATVKATMDWETAWAGVTKTVDGSDAQMAALEEGLRELAKTLPATHEEIAAVAEAAGQLGVAREDILSFTKTMIDLGETTNLTADEAATSIAQMANVMQTAPGDIDNLGAALVALGNAGASTERDIIQMSQRISGTGAQIGLMESDILAIANAAASMGIEVEAGGSAISRVFTELAKATASGGPKLETFAETAGMSADAFTRLFESAPAEAFAAFTQGLDSVNKSGGDVFSLLKELGMSDVRVSQAMLSMAASGDLLTDSLELGREAWAENTALVEEAEKRYGTTASQARIAWNEIKDAGIDAGAALLPVVSTVASTVGNLANAFSALPGPVKSSLTGLAGLTAVLGGGIWAGSKLVSGVASFRGALDGLGGSATGVRGKLGGVVQMLGGPWAVALGGATVAVGLLMNEHGKAAGYVDSLTAALEDQTGAMTRNTIATNLQDEGWLEYAEDIGVSSETVIDAALGSAAAMDEVRIAAEKARGSAWNPLNGENWTNDSEELIANIEAQSEAQKQAQEEARLLAEATGEAGDAAADAAGPTGALAGAAGGLGDELAGAAAEAADFEATIKSLNAELSGRASIRDYEAALDDFRDSVNETGLALTKNGRKFDINTEKGRQNQAMLDDIVSSALNVAESMGEADRQKFLSRSIQDIRTMAKNMGLPKDEVRALIALLKEADTTRADPKVKVHADTTAAERAKRLIDSLISKTITVTTVSRTVQGGRRNAHAEGGYITGPGTATSDSIPAYLSNGEYVIRAAAVQKYGVNMFDGLNAMRFAEGGRVATGGRGGGRGGGRLELDLSPAIAALTAAVERQTEMLSEAEKARDAVLGKMTSLADATTAMFNTDLFDRGTRGKGGGLFGNLADDIAGLEQRKLLQQQLADLGLEGDAMAALLSEGTNADIAGLIASGSVEKYAALYEQRAALQESVGSAAGEFAYGPELAEQTSVLRAMQVQLDALSRDLKAAEKRGEKSADRRSANNAVAVGAAVNTTAATTARHKRAKQRPKAGAR